ncbi:MAG: hypothetical protein CBR30_09875 [Dictyoglomus sp. NZ13-RE01]|nr:MAG: hypothetical protein CBR30_09875 [Dictyoglomus sp. NZ13-RE01]
MSENEDINMRALRALTDFMVWLRKASDSMLAKYVQKIEPMITEFIDTEIHDVVRIALNNARELYMNEISSIASWIGDLMFCNGLLIAEAAYLNENKKYLKSRKARLISDVLSEISVRLQVKLWNLELKINELIKVV